LNGVEVLANFDDGALAGRVAGDVPEVAQVPSSRGGGAGGVSHLLQRLGTVRTDGARRRTAEVVAVSTSGCWGIEGRQAHEADGSEAARTNSAALGQKNALVGQDI
jgi:hypothetical protein